MNDKNSVAFPQVYRNLIFTHNWRRHSSFCHARFGNVVTLFSLTMHNRMCSVRCRLLRHVIWTLTWCVLIMFKCLGVYMLFACFNTYSLTEGRKLTLSKRWSILMLFSVRLANLLFLYVLTDDKLKIYYSYLITGFLVKIKLLIRFISEVTIIIIQRSNAYRNKSFNPMEYTVYLTRKKRTGISSASLTR